jgi:hypothetical protein
MPWAESCLMNERIFLSRPVWAMRDRSAKSACGSGSAARLATNGANVTRRTARLVCVTPVQRAILSCTPSRLACRIG